VFSVLCMIAAGLIRTGAQASKKPNFSGTWVLNMHKSKLGMPAVPVGAIWVIEHEGTKFRLERTEIYRSGLHDKQTLDLVTDGKQELVQQDGPYHEVSRMYWSGNALVLDTKITTSDGAKETAEGRTMIRYSLSADGKTMTATESNQVPDAKWGSRWVFYRQASQKSPAAHGQSKKKKIG
jgi:hypothetical protein